MNDERLGLPSASGAERHVACPVSHRLQALAPKEESTDPLATEGSLIHEALEREDGSELNMGQTEIYEKLKELDQELYKQWRIDFPVEDKGVEIKEERFFVYDNSGKPTGSAKSDHIYIIGNCALNIDAKTGFKEVRDSSSNWQGRLQALALIANNPELDHIRVAFAQFRLRKYYTVCDYTRQDLEYALMEWNLSNWKSIQPDAIANPGEWCTGCKAKAYCKAAGAISLLPSVEVKGGQVFNQKDNPAAIRDAVSAMTVPDLIAIYERRSIIETVMESVKSRLKSLEAETLKALGYELKAGAVYTTKIEINPLFQLLWDDGIWNNIPEDKRQDEAIKEFSTITTALTGKLSDLVMPKYTSSGRFKTTKDAKDHLKRLVDQVSTSSRKESTLKKLKE